MKRHAGMGWLIERGTFGICQPHADLVRRTASWSLLSSHALMMPTKRLTGRSGYGIDVFARTSHRLFVRDPGNGIRCPGKPGG